MDKAKRWMEKTWAMQTWVGILESTGFRSKGGTANWITRVNLDGRHEDFDGHKFSKTAGGRRLLRLLERISCAYFD